MKKLLAALVSIFLLVPFVAAGQVSGSLWKLSSLYLYPVNSSWGIAIPALANNNCIGTDSNGKFQAGTCSGGGGSGGAATSSFSATYPLKLTTSSSAINYSLLDMATTTVSCSGSVTCSSFTVIGSSPVTISGTGSWPFTPTTNFGVSVQSTSTPIWDTAGIQASSTSQFLNENVWGTLTLTNALAPTSGGTGINSYTLGDTLYASGSNTLAKLAGNTASTTYYLSMTGDGTNAAAPSWQPIAIPGTSAYYAYGQLSTSSAAYKKMSVTATTTSATLAYTLSSGTQTVQNWITNTGVPGLSVIPAGPYIVDLFAWRSSGSASITLSIQFWEVDSSGADISEIGTTNSTPNLTNSVAQYNLAVTLGQHTMASTNSRIVARLVAVSAGTPTLSVNVGDGYPTDFLTPGPSASVGNFVPYTGATKNLDLGTFNASTTEFTIGSGWWTPQTSALLVTDANGKVGSYGGSSCTNQFARSVNAAGAWTCATVSASDVSLANLTATDSTLTFSGTYNGSTARTIGINLGNANTWTALQTITNASTTNLSAGSSNYMVNPLNMQPVTIASSTWGTGTTTLTLFGNTRAFTIVDVSCPNDSGLFLGVDVYYSSTHLNYLISSSTQNTFKFSTNNVIPAGNKVQIDIGTSTAPSTGRKVFNCTFEYTYNSSS